MSITKQTASVIGLQALIISSLYLENNTRHEKIIFIIKSLLFLILTTVTWVLYLKYFSIENMYSINQSSISLHNILNKIHNIDFEILNMYILHLRYTLY